MIQKFIHKQNHSRLLLFFAGWGMDEHPFADYHPADADLMICYDYRYLHFDNTSIAGYSEITLIAWSMGVWAASVLLPACALPITKAIAINGTSQPVDKTQGIDPDICQGTLEQLSETGLRKFYRRMCDSTSVFTDFLQTAPQRPVDELREELETIIHMSTSGQYRSTLPWDEAYVADRDRIFTPQNQHRNWQNTSATVHSVDEGHYCPLLFNTLLQNG